MKNQKGITLIALVITIVVLIILSSVAIKLSLSEDGIFGKAKYAKNMYSNAAISEEESLNELYAYLESDGLPANSKENPQSAGTIVRMPSTWAQKEVNYVSTQDGKTVNKVTKVASVYAVATGNGETVPVPKGFYYVGGTLSTGVVISSKEEDSYLKNGRDMSAHSDAVNLKGDQFVFVPCSASSYTKFTLSDYTTNLDSKKNASWDEYTDALELAQIEKYGGFYIGRYEAGTSEVKGLDFSAEMNTGWGNSNYTVNNAGANSKPTTKAGEIPYFHSNYETAIKMCRKMYNTDYVYSDLITGTQWDMALKYITNNTYSEMLNTSWGNYKDITLTNCIGKYCEVDADGNTGSWRNNTTKDNKSGGTYTILTTGSTEDTKKKNIYDLAGNLWEWTNEASYYSDGAVRYMLRGGSFYDSYSDNPVCYRNTNTAGNTNTNNGFRPVL